MLAEQIKAYMLFQCANFKVKKKFHIQKILNSVNFFLQKNLISILSIKEEFKFSFKIFSKRKEYEYQIINREGPLSIYKDKAWHIKQKIDIKLLKKVEKF